jgi:hypothetical protein
MKRDNFVGIRRHLGKTQEQMSQILGLSLKAIQSFEQGWRNIPVHVERQGGTPYPVRWIGDASILAATSNR